MKLWLLQRYLRKVDNPVLWMSGGADSTLLLHVLLKLSKPFSILRFDEGQTREQKAVTDALILKYDLRAYSYRPSWSMMVGDGTNLSLVSGYAVGRNGETATLFRDLVDGPACSFDVQVPVAKNTGTPIFFENHILGTRKSDTHYALNGKRFLSGKRWVTGEAMFHAPLYSWNRATVINGLKAFGVNYIEPSDQVNSGNLTCCSLCLRPNETGKVFCPKTHTEIDNVKWDPVGQLRQWQIANGV